MRHDRLAPRELLDVDGEGMYFRAQNEDWFDRPARRAMRLFGCGLDEIEGEAATFITRDDGESWERISFKDWRWMWPLSHWHQPALYLYYAPKGQGNPDA